MLLDCHSPLELGAFGPGSICSKGGSIAQKEPSMPVLQVIFSIKRICDFSHIIQPSNEVQPPPVPFPKRLRKEKDEVQQKKFLENLKQLHIILPFIEALAQMPKYAKFLKGLLTNKIRLEEACKIIINDRCSAVLLNKLLSKEKDPGSFTIPCDIGQLHIDNALADLGASISLMPYTMYKKLGLGEPKATRMSLELADRYARRFKSSIILGRPFLAIARAMIDVFNKKITLRVGGDEVIFDVDQSIKRPTTEDDECYGIDDLDETINEEARELENEEPDNGSDSENSIRHIDSLNTPYPVTQGTLNGDNVKCEHLYSASANEIDEKKPELKNWPKHLEYAYLHGDKSFPIIISSKLSENEKTSLLMFMWENGDNVTSEHMYSASANDIDEKKPELKNLPQHLEYAYLHGDKSFPIIISSELSENEKTSLLSWVSPIHVVPKKGRMTVVLNDNNELIPSRTVTGWRVCIDYCKLNDATRKDHFPLPFIDQMLERLCGNEYYCFLNGFSGFFQIPIASEDQEKTTFTCPYGTFAYRRMPFGLCNAPATFQRCMTAIFHDMVEDFMEVFMDDFSVFGNSFDCCLANLDRMLARCEETNLVLNWEKCHFMVKEGIVLGHKISRAGIEVDRVKIDVIAKLPYPTNVKGVRSFLGHAGFYRSFIKDFSMISKPMTQFLMKDANKTLNNAQEHYTITKKELLAVVFSFDKFCQYLVLSKTVVYTDHSALNYLFCKQDAKPRLIRWVLLLQGFNIEIKDKKGAENLAADHLSRLKNPNLGTFVEEEITNEFLDEHLMILKAKLNNDEPWYADYINYIVGKIIPLNWTPGKRRRFFSQVKYYFWDKPYAFKLCSDNVMRRCVAGNKIFEILAHCHSGPTGGHHSASITGRKVYESGFYWPSIFKDAKDYVMKCDACQRSGNISSRSEMPQNNIQVCDVFDIWGLDFMGPFPNSKGINIY
ncbi:reverse transcriptase domain-containing protein [Tanacetum coccineum]